MKRLLAPLRRRVRLSRALNGLVWGTALGAFACAVLLAVSFFVPLAGLSRWLAPLAVAGLLLGLLVGLLWPVSIQLAARKADAAGLKERAITALALADGAAPSPFASVQRSDAEAALRRLDAKAAVPMQVPRPLWITSVALVMAASLLGILPNPQDDVLRARANTRAQLSAQADELEEAAERMAERGLMPEEASELRRITSEMARALRDAQDRRDALERLDRHQEEMDRLDRRIAKRQRQQTAQALSAQASLSGLGRAMSQGSEAAAQEAMDQIAQTLEAAQGSETLADELARAAESAAAGAATQLAKAAQAAASGNSGAAMSALAAASGMGGDGQSAGNTGANLSALMQVARSGQMGQGTGAGGAGSGGGGSGGGGSGAGRGTTQQDAGNSQGGAARGDTGSGGFTERVGAYEQIYDPTRLGGDSDATHVEGTQRNEETQQLPMGPGEGDMDGMVPYPQVIGEYQAAAAQAMRRDALPEALRERVTNYFNALID